MRITISAILPNGEESHLFIDVTEVTEKKIIYYVEKESSLQGFVQSIAKDENPHGYAYLTGIVEGISYLLGLHSR